MRTKVALAAIATVASLAVLAPPAWAGATYMFAGSVTSISAPLLGGALALGDPVHMTVTLGAPVSDTDPASSVGVYAGAIDSWTLELGSFVTTGTGGDVLVCDSPGGASSNCGSTFLYGWWNGVWAGKDGVRFVTRELTSLPIVLNGYTQACFGTNLSCGNANVYDDTATALTNTDVPTSLDPATFGSSANNGRVLFGPQGFVGFSMSVVAEPSTYALVALGVGLLGLAGGRRKA